MIVDDEPEVLRLLRRTLEREGDVVEVAPGGDEAITKALTNSHDVIVLDVVMPAPDGFEVCRRLRERGCWTPILLMTGEVDSVEKRVEGLDAGADDFLSKPFSVEELRARLRALTRRKLDERPTVLKAGDLSLDPATHTVTRGDVPIRLTVREFALLELLMRRAGRVLTRAEMLAEVWGITHHGSSNVVEVYIRYLRDKIDRPFGRSSIESVRGVGYRLRNE